MISYLFSFKQTPIDRVTTIALSLFFLALSSCALNPKQANTPAEPQSSLAIHEQHLAKIAEIKRFNIKGRIGVQTNPKGFSGGLSWQHLPERDEIALFSPLGGQVASIEKTAQQVTLTDNKGNTVSEKNAETLTQNSLGWQLPLDGLSDWVLGRPSPAVTTHSTWDADGKLRNLEQDGWKIEYLEYNIIDGYALPSKMHLVHPNVTIKLILQQQTLS